MNKEIEFSDLGMLLVISFGLALITILVEQLFNIDILNFLKDSLKI